MTISMIPNSATITLTTQPYPFIPFLSQNQNGVGVEFRSSPINATGNNFPITLTVQSFDAPRVICTPMQVNSLTGKPNYLREVQFEFLFCTILAVRSQPHSGPFTQLLHFYWNIHWQFLFEPISYANAPNIDSWNQSQVRQGAGANVGQLNPNIRESPVWADFNVMR